MTRSAEDKARWFGAAGGMDARGFVRRYRIQFRTQWLHELAIAIYIEAWRQSDRNPNKERGNKRIDYVHAIAQGRYRGYIV